MAVVAAIVVGIAAGVLSGPRNGSVEWHKREYRDTRLYLGGYKLSLLDWVIGVCNSVTGRLSPRFTGGRYVELCEKIDAHEKALLDAGFLGKREVPLDGVAIGWVMANFQSKDMIERYARLDLRSPANGDNVLVVTGPPGDLAKWEAAARRGGRPEWK
jgi:hypothetical protein